MAKRETVFARLRIDPALIIVLLLATYATWPLLTRPGLPTFNDGEQHVYRTLEVMANWQAGIPYARWAPDVYHGFGSPVFNYYSPLIYYLAAGYAWFGAGPVAGIKLVMVFSAYLGAIGMYALVRNLWGSLAGLVGAAVFSLSPYLAYIDPVARCDVSELLAFAIVPWLLWVFKRVLLRGGVYDQALAAVVLAGLIFSHNLVALIFFVWLLAWLLVLWAEAQREGEFDNPRRAALRVLAPIVLGVGLAACLWLPAVAERHAVRLSDATVGYLDFRRTFVPWNVMLRPASVVISPEWQMGVPQWVLAALGVLSPFFVRARRGLVAFLALSVIVMVGLMLPVSLPIWERLPLLGFLQFPWRLLGPAMVVSALLSGAAVSWCTRWRWWAAKWQGHVLFVGAAIAACVIAAFPLLDPLPWADFENATVKRLLTAGLDWWAGTTASNEFLPASVQSMPAAQPALLQSYETGLVDKVNRAQLPPEAQVAVVEHTAVRDRFQTSSSTPFTLGLYTFYFPGWTAYVDGAPSPIIPSQPEGWITTAVPDGEHEVRVQFEDTWPRRLGWGLTIGAALGWIGLLVFRRGRPASTKSIPDSSGLRLVLVLGSIVVMGLGVRYVADQFSWWRIKPNKVEKPAAQHELWAPLESNMALIGYDLPQVSGKPGASISVTLYWEAFAPVTRNVRVFVHLLGADGKLWGVSDHLRPGGFLTLPTTRWEVYRYVLDEHELMPDPSAPAGTYTLRVGLWDGMTGERMRTLDASEQPTDQDGIVLTDSFVIVQP